MDKIAKLTIDPKTFDLAVWYTESGFTQRNYNEWVTSTVIPVLEQLYEKLDDDIDPSDLNVMRDVINVFRNTQIIVNK